MDDSMAAASITRSPLAGLEALWTETLGDPGINIAVLDGPVDRTHPSFAGANLEELGGPPSGFDEGAALRHGTQVASVIFGQHDGPLKGIAPRCRGLLLPVFRSGDRGIAPCSQLDLAHAITRAVEGGASVINVSGGEFSSSGAAHPLLEEAVQRAVGRALIVSAAGNEGCDCLNIPGALQGVLSVGAADALGMPLSSSNWGSAYQTQGILALGADLPVAEVGGATTRASGTSYATAIVAGVAGLLLSLQRQRGEEPNPLAVWTALLESAFVCDPRLTADCRPFLVGLLDIAGARARFAEPRPGLLQVGRRAPDLALPDHTGQVRRLADYRGRTIVLWFFPRADTPG